MDEIRVLIKNYVKDPRLTSNFLPSSPFLVRQISKMIDFEKASCVVEYGPSTGSITRKLLRMANKNLKLICFELNGEFCRYLRTHIKDPRLIVIHDDAASLRKHLRRLNIRKVDYFISGIPFYFIPPKKKEEILKESENLLKSDGKFILYQCHHDIKKNLLAHFKSVHTKFILFNIFPVFLFSCQK